MKIRKSLLAIFASLAMVITMIPLDLATVSAKADSYGFALYYDSSDGTMHKNYINGEEVDANVVPGWTGDGNTLTLNNFNFVTSAIEGLVVPEGTTIVVKGNSNDIRSIYEGNIAESCYGIRVETNAGANAQGTEGNNSLTFKGAGNLTVLAGKPAQMSYGIGSQGGSILFEGTGTITATGATTTTEYYKNESFGISAEGGEISVTDGKVIATGGNLKGKKGMSSGIMSKTIILTGSEIVAVGGQANDSIGVGATTLTVTDAKVTATGGPAENYICRSAGININDDISFTDSEIKATGGSATGRPIGESAGIVAEGKMSVSGGNITAIGGDCSTDGSVINSSSIKGEAFLTESKGSTIAAVSEFQTGSFGIFAMDEDDATRGMDIDNGATVTATAQGSENGYSFGIATTAFNLENGTAKAKAAKDASKSAGVFSIARSGKSTININYNGLTAQGGTVALSSGDINLENNLAANFGKGINVKGSTDYDGSNLTAYVKENNSSYKYVKTEAKEKPPAPAPDPSDDKDKKTDVDKDKKTDVDKDVQTGDTSNMTLWIVLLCISGGAIITGVIANKRRKIK